MAEAYSGTCFCGAVEIEATGAPLEMGYCHCNSCRAYSGGPISAYILWNSDNVRVTRGAKFLGGYNKTGLSNRQFCRQCGGHVMTTHPGLGVTDIRAAVIPSLTFVPTVHLNYAESVLPIRDGLPKLKDLPAEAGGSGAMMAE
ncbi:GFA family protein [Rhizobium sp. ARZ01]|uniref:GFA family protein n=1 Tax=Rhizobium sp. ARZ01 TaxID=2769313 RepID=UPI00177F252F|nr:GFA family protein [Rhizobium sp. ARZ01]MBD9373293.1 GFA family protein [Rhizobium sp. ARZ01]